jgi:hypothetical protein
MLFIAITHKWSMIRRSLDKPCGLSVAHNHVSAGLNQFAAPAAMNGWIVLAKGRFAVNEYGFTSRSGTPPI